MRVNFAFVYKSVRMVPGTIWAKLYQSFAILVPGTILALAVQSPAAVPGTVLLDLLRAPQAEEAGLKQLTQLAAIWA